MKYVILAFTLMVAGLVSSCSSSGNPKVENCKIGCDSRGRHSAEFKESCKRMCEKYK